MKNCNLVALLSIILLLCGCKKELTPEQNCAKIKNVKIVAGQDSYIVGDEIHLQVNDMPDIAMYVWTHANNPNMISSDPDLVIHYAEKGDEGWYYLNVSNPDCESHFDSIYIEVKNDPTMAPCSPDNNTVTFSSIPDINPASVGWGYNTNWNRRVLRGTGGYGYPDFSIYFNTNWDTTEPEDGAYSITTMMETDNFPAYTVYISSLYDGVLFQANSGKVYVSHVNGKLRVTFCDVPMTGSDGSYSFKTTASGMLTAP